MTTASSEDSATKKTAAKKSPAKKTAKKTTEKRASAPRASAAKRATASQVAARAAQQLLELTGKGVEGVTGLERTDDGWKVHVEVVIGHPSLGLVRPTISRPTSSSSHASASSSESSPEARFRATSSSCARMRPGS